MLLNPAESKPMASEPRDAKHLEKFLACNKPDRTMVLLH